MIKTIIADLNALLARIENDVTGHRAQGQAAANVKAAVTALEARPDAVAAPVTPDAPVAAAAPANDAPEAAADPVNSAAPTA